MTYVIRFGKNYRFLDERDIEVCDTLPAQNYTVQLNEMSGEYYLEPIHSFQMPSKLYGNTEKNARRILATFNSRPNSTGVLLSGVKGSGKTLLAKVVSSLASKVCIPTIVINRPYTGDSFNKFIQNIDMPSIVLFDEFEKVYDYKDQEKILTLLDGVYNSKKLFILTVNRIGGVTEFMSNRPGRIYYKFNFDTLPISFVREYCEDNLLNKNEIENVVRYVQVFNFFNFDMLAASIEEMNRYGETLPQVLDYLNITPESKSDETYTITFHYKGNDVVYNSHYRGFQPNQFEYNIDIETSDFNDLKKTKKALYNELTKLANEDLCFEFNASHIADYDPIQNKFTYVIKFNQNEVKMVVQKNMTLPQFDYKSFLAYV
jgi:hypothetical protein